MTPRTWRSHWLLGLASLIACGALWELASRLSLHNLFPPPSRVLQTAVGMALSGELVKDIGFSLQRAAIGYAMACIFGVGFGMLTGRSKLGEATVGSVIQVLRPIPNIAVAPFALLWFGLGETSKYFVVLWGSAFPIWINTHLGMREVNPEMIWAAASLGTSPRQMFFSVIFPASLSHIIAGMRTAIAGSFVCLVAAEMSGAFSGLGYRIEASHMVFRVDRMMVAIVTLGLLGAACDFAFSTMIHKLAPWYGRRRQE